jgi:hypothetical protein
MSGWILKTGPNYQNTQYTYEKDWVYFKKTTRIIKTHVSHIKTSRTLLYRVRIMKQEKLL